MQNRRRFIQSGIAVSAASSIGVNLAAASPATPQFLNLERFVFDVRFAESYDLGQAVAGTGVQISGFADDLMSLWYDDLDLRWKDAPMAIGGITLPEALFVFETLAMDRGMRLIYRGDHEAVEDGIASHNLEGPAEMLAGLDASLERTGWVAAVSDAVTQCPVSAKERTRLEFVTNESGPALRDMPLCSWIIAPRQAIAANREA